MTSYQPPPTIEISEEQAAHFVDALREALKRMTVEQRKEVRLIVRDRQAIAISCDGKNQPFLGYTAGYNPPDKRTALPIDDFILYKIRTWLLIRRKPGPKGGRVFITSDGAYTLPQNEPKIILCKWKWSKKDIVKEVLALLEESVAW